MKTVNVFPVTRIESEGKLILYLNDDDIIEKAYFYPSMPIRGFEYMLVGKDMEFLTTAAMRICGVCHVTHGIAAAEAAEDTLQLIPPRDGLILREMCGLGNRLQSHALHMLSILNDLFKGDREIMKNIFAMLESANEIVKITGHESVHPSNICVGGMRKNISEKGMEEIIKYAKEYKNLMEDFRNLLVESLEKLKDEGAPETMGNVRLPTLATHPYYGDSSKIDILDISLMPPGEYYDSELAMEESASILVKYKNEITEVGPKARMRSFFKFTEKVPLSINVAYADDAILGCERIIEACDEININGKTRMFSAPRKGRGMGVHEAPRGTNMHVLSLREDGIISDYRIVVPTMFNISVIDRALAGAPKDFAELIVRSYDPCLSCATHMVQIKEEKLSEGGVL